MSLREAQSVQDQARREEEELQAALRASMEATAQQRSHTGQDQLPDCSSSAPTTSHPRNHTIALSDDEFDSMIDQSSLSQRLNDSESSVINLLDTTDEHPQPSSSNGRSKRKRPLTSSIDLSEDNETAPSTSRGRKKKALLDQVVDGCDSSRRKKKPNPPPPPPPMEDSNDVSSSRWKPSSRNVALDDSIDLDVPSPENDNSADSDYTDDQNESIESDFEAPDSSGGGPAFKVVTIPSQHSKSSDFYRQYREAESFYKKAVASTTSRKPLKIKSIDVVLNRELESRFEQLRETLANEGAPFEDSLSFHVASVSGGNMDRILRSNLHPRYATGQAFGNGLYFSKTPNSDEALFVCKIIPGRVFEDGSPCNIPLGYNSKKVTNLRNSGVDVTIVGGPDQILPSYVIYLER